MKLFCFNSIQINVLAFGIYQSLVVSVNFFLVKKVHVPRVANFSRGLVISQMKCNYSWI